MVNCRREEPLRRGSLDAPFPWSLQTAWATVAVQCLLASTEVRLPTDIHTLAGTPSSLTCGSPYPRAKASGLLHHTCPSQQVCQSTETSLGSFSGNKPTSPGPHENVCFVDCTRHVADLRTHAF